MHEELALLPDVLSVVVITTGFPSEALLNNIHMYILTPNVQCIINVIGELMVSKLCVEQASIEAH